MMPKSEPLFSFRQMAVRLKANDCVPIAKLLQIYWVFYSKDRLNL